MRIWKETSDSAGLATKSLFCMVGIMKSVLSNKSDTLNVAFAIEVMSLDLLSIVSPVTWSNMVVVGFIVCPVHCVKTNIRTEIPGFRTWS